MHQHQAYNKASEVRVLIQQAHYNINNLVFLIYRDACSTFVVQSSCFDFCKVIVSFYCTDLLASGGVEWSWCMCLYTNYVLCMYICKLNHLALVIYKVNRSSCSFNQKVLLNDW